MITAFPYQTKAVEELGAAIQRARTNHRNNGSPLAYSPTVSLKAPTGAGKTVILAQVIDKYLSDHIVLLLSPGAGDLETQTYNSVSNILGSSRVRRLDTVSVRLTPSPGETYVTNWEALVAKDKGNQYKTRLSRDSETLNIWTWLNSISNNDIPVALVIDESHHGAKNAKSSIAAFQRDISATLGYPPLIIEASATPRLKEGTEDVVIPVQEVIDAGMLRKQVVLNYDVDRVLNSWDDEEVASKTSEQVILEAALELQKTLDAEYKKIGSDYHSLICIQLPTSKEGKEALERFEKFFNERGMGFPKDNAPGELATYLHGANGRRGDISNIASPDSPIKVLFYKQGISTGWDCPRAQILIGFRHLSSDPFKTQNLGRFVRTTERKHYGNTFLDTTFVFTNTKSDLGVENFNTENEEGFPPGFIAQYRDGEALSSFESKNLVTTSLRRTYRELVDFAPTSKSFQKHAKTGLTETRIPTERLTEKLRKGRNTTETVLNEGGIREENLQEIEKEINSVAPIRLMFNKAFNDYITGLDEPRLNPVTGRLTEYLYRITTQYLKYAIFGTPSEKKGKEHYGSLSHLYTSKENTDKEVFSLQVVLDKKNWEKIFTPLYSKVLDDLLKENEEGISAIRSEIMPTHTVTDGEMQYASTHQPVTHTWSVPKQEWVGHSDSHYKGTLNDLYAFKAPNGVSRRGVKASGPEELFESYLESEPEHRTVSFWKNPVSKDAGLGILVRNEENSKLVYSIHYPDYLVELRSKTKNAVLPALFEVKDKAGAEQKETLRKAKALIEYGKKYELLAGVVFVENGIHKIITEVDDDFKVATTPSLDSVLEEYLK